MFIQALRQLVPSRRRADGTRSAKTGLSLPVAPGRVPRAERAWNPDILHMDSQTFRDLEIFEVEGGARSLFELLDTTRTAGGSKVLRSRMRQPFSNADRIRRVQDAVRYIAAHRAAFDLLPGEIVLTVVEGYIYSALTLITARSPIELFLESLEIRFGEAKEFWQITRGVQTTARMIRALKQLLERPQLADPPGELATIVGELRTAVDTLSAVRLPAEGEAQLSAWRLMRLDQTLRLHRRDAVERVMRLVYEIDALVAMADAGRNLGFVLPELHEGPLAIVADGVFHPFLERPVRNPVRVDATNRLLFLTGPNMAGKTTYLRACGIATYLAHLGMGVPARSFRFSPCQCLFTAIARADSIHAGISFFRAEALRMKTIAQALAEGRRVVALLDEPFMGTNVKDAYDASRAVFGKLAEADGLFLVSSHLIELGDVLSTHPHVACARFEADECGGRLEFDYTLRPGISAQRLGFRVLTEEGVFDLLARATEGSEQRLQPEIHR